MEPGLPHQEYIPSSFPIVGIGASAGGLRAIGELLESLPPDIGMAFIVIQHLDPTHHSLLANLLARTSRLRIEEASDGCEVRPNRVYVITPNTTITLVKRRLCIIPRESGPGPHLTIDSFLHSLAVDQPNNAIGIILSGTGTDGTHGLTAIKASGGLTFTQDDSAEYGGMPLSAASASRIDFVLAPADMAKELEKIAEFGFPRLPHPADVTEDEDEGLSGQPPLEEDPEQYAVIMSALHTATGVDFAQYRSTTITRRIMRRMAMTSQASLAQYAELLASTPREIDFLARDVLIHVTSFYRDHTPFKALRAKVFPALMANRDANSSIRLWVAGCSTGQEVYSLAIELEEFVKDAATRPRVQIFATDISDWALTKARIGWYPESIADEIPEDRLARYFTKDKLGYRILKSIRDCCVFAKHDITADIPFSRIDLISCRNVLIYLGTTLQQRVIPTFHFSLMPGGFLLLGTSETVGRGSNLYETIDAENRIYRAKLSSGRRHPAYVHSRSEGEPRMPSPSEPFAPSLPEMQRAADQIILGRLAPASILVNESMEILQLRGNTSPFLELPQGEPNLNLLTMVPFGVAGALREAVNTARQTGTPTRKEGIVHRRREAIREISFEVIPIKLPLTTVGCFLVIFNEQGPSSPSQMGLEAAPAATSMPQGKTSPAELETSHLRSELAAASDYVHSLVEQVHVLTEQLKSAQEEAASNSEEFRSTNEELQTAKEEVESTNEELVTINDELSASNAGLAKLASELRASGELTAAIVETVSYPLLVLDGSLNVDSVNSAFLQSFHVERNRAVGRKIYELGNGQWDIPDLRRLLENVLPNDSAFDGFEVTHDFRDIGRRTMLLNARRLQDQGDRSGLIVLVIADITEQAQATKNLKDLSDELLRSNAELDQFASVASHDLQEPLRMMSNYISLLDRQYKHLFDDRARQYMAYVVDGAQRMSGMIRAILTYARLGHEAAVVSEIDCEDAFRDALANLKTKIEEAEVTIRDGKLPRVQANRDQLTQLFQNLLSNAIKFRSDTRPPEIHISAQESQTEWTFSIADNGIGMEKADFGKLFQLFKRLNARNEPGTGIGLATCKKIVDHHQGRIWVESTVGIGSTFFFTLPK